MAQDIGLQGLGRPACHDLRVTKRLLSSMSRQPELLNGTSCRVKGAGRRGLRVQGAALGVQGSA